MRTFKVKADTIKELLTKVTEFSAEIQASNERFCQTMNSCGIECTMKDGKLIPIFATCEEEELYYKLRKEQLDVIYLRHGIEIE
jgi:hypothetical protein